MVTGFSLSPQQFQQKLLAWFDQHGRKNLPWQQNKSPYSVWISEIMLQQTQVNTVIPYYLQFMQTFPTVFVLADSTLDKVLHLWSGLGFYSRARHLHQAAKIIVNEFAGKFPADLSTLISLPGIGHSTAGAILSLAFNHPAAILDGNVKRVLARLHGIREPINQKKIENKLWQIAGEKISLTRASDYTQAMMDFGATHCLPAHPACGHCMFKKKCVAHQLGRVHEIPTKTLTRPIPVRQATLFILQYKKHVLLKKRTQQGVWEGLWSFPEISGEPTDKILRLFCQQFKIPLTTYEPLPSFRHTFSHFHLEIFPIKIPLKTNLARLMEANEQIWYNLQNPAALGLPKAIQKILRGLACHA